ncbi:hypothetical protein BD626DRAFT_80261 [Schizophyllum amplum]|uniref:Uncharacterized protein n=1 Tax=Schizophyllum amplum TaxID=97359 RepID=A0A550C9W8_9AGAR|nr:hypothetical protein BD626DRAFT_80261 [Auriculariopsis ampla]
MLRLRGFCAKGLSRVSQERVDWCPSPRPTPEFPRHRSQPSHAKGAPWCPSLFPVFIHAYHLSALPDTLQNKENRTKQRIEEQTRGRHTQVRKLGGRAHKCTFLPAHLRGGKPSPTSSWRGGVPRPGGSNSVRHSPAYPERLRAGGHQGWPPGAASARTTGRSSDCMVGRSTCQASSPRSLGQRSGRVAPRARARLEPVPVTGTLEHAAAAVRCKTTSHRAFGTHLGVAPASRGCQAVPSPSCIGSPSWRRATPAVTAIFSLSALLGGPSFLLIPSSWLVSFACRRSGAAGSTDEDSLSYHLYLLILFVVSTLLYTYNTLLIYPCSSRACKPARRQTFR